MCRTAAAQGWLGCQGFRMRNRERLWQLPAAGCGQGRASCTTVPIRASWSPCRREKIRRPLACYEDRLARGDGAPGQPQRQTLETTRPVRSDRHVAGLTMQAQTNCAFRSPRWLTSLLNELRRIAPPHPVCRCHLRHHPAEAVERSVPWSVSSRPKRIKFAMASGFPWQNEFDALPTTNLQQRLPDDSRAAAGRFPIMKQDRLPPPSVSGMRSRPARHDCDCLLPKFLAHTINRRPDWTICSPQRGVGSSPPLDDTAKLGLKVWAGLCPKTETITPSTRRPVAP